MTATKTTKPAKDGTATAYTQAMATESVAGDLTPLLYLAEPVNETLVSPATSTKQPALGTAGTPSADVLSVQGIASGTALKVDGSAVTQPVSGTVTANLGTIAGTSTAANQASQLTQETAISTAIGAQADVAWVSGVGSLVALLKKIAGGAPSTIADGADITQGITSDGAWSGSGTSTVVSALKAIYAKVAGIIGVSQSGSWTVTSNAGTNLNTSALALDSTLAATVSTQGSALAGIKGNLNLASVTTASPAYTTGQVSPLSLDTAGLLRVNVVTGGGAGGTSSTFGAAFPGPGTAMGAKNGANMVNLVADAAGNLLTTSLSSGAITNPTSVLTRPATAVTSAVTATSASPCVFTWTGNPLLIDHTVILSGTAVPTGFTAGVPYYVRTVSGNTFQLAATLGGAAINSTSTGTAVVATVCYVPGTFIGPSASAFSIATSGGGAILPRIRILSNIASGWDGVNLSINLWNTAPVHSHVDGGVYGITTGAAGWLANFLVSLTQFGDGAVGAGGVTGANEAAIDLASGTSIFWDLQILTQANPAVSQTFTIIPELLN